MKNLALKTYYLSKKKYNILGNLEIQLYIKENDFKLSLNSIFEMAARKNKKRKFLFVSKLLGKHIPVNPNIPRISGALLAFLFLFKIEKNISIDVSLLIKAISDYKKIPKTIDYINKTNFNITEPTLFIGFAETATGLGHAMYSTFSGNTGFIHTTRDTIKELDSILDFDEEHSHDTQHLCYSFYPEFIDKFKKIVLIDDEITTGNTALNLIKVLNNKYPNKKYVIASFLDWRKDEEINNFYELEKELSIDILCISLIKGNIVHKENINNFLEEKYPAILNTKVKNEIKIKDNAEIETISISIEDKHFLTLIQNNKSEDILLYLNYTGRFGLYSHQNTQVNLFVNKISKHLIKKRKSGKLLCLGFNEFIYIPSLISCSLGNDVYFQSTTRSPIFTNFSDDYCVKTVINFRNPYDSSINNYCYNILPNQYDEIFFFLERDINNTNKNDIAYKFLQFGIKTIKFIVFC